MATLVLAWSPVTASVLLTVDGTTWTTVPATVTATRQPSGGEPVKVRGIIGKAVAGGFLVATDHEMPLNTSVAYVVTGYSTAGATVGTATATVSTTATTPGVFMKAPGRPDLTVFCQPSELGDVTSPTVGGVYQVIGGDAVAVAQWSSVAANSTSLALRANVGLEVDRLKAMLGLARVLLIQPVGMSDLDAGWYFAGSATWSNPGHFEAFAFRRCMLPLQQVGMPSGQPGGAGWTWAMLAATYATWTAAKAAYPSWFAAQQGPA